jgi:cystathionine beta-lyase/cystathionine gamma-synthase
MESSLAFATQAVHAGERAPKPDFTPVNTPIYQSASFVYDTLETMDAIFGGERPGYVYTRYGNPTVAALERAVATLEGGDTAVAYASGMAAIHATLLALEVVSGVAVVAAQDLYGATSTLLTTIFAPQGVNVHLVDMTDLDRVERAIHELRPKVVLAEIISNPLLKVVDLQQVATLAHADGATMVVDSTFTSPYLLQPLRYGADFVIHSTTKSLGGHGDVTGGIVVAPAVHRPKLELVDGDRERVFAFLNGLQLCLPATTLGDIYTELLYPTISSHRILSPEQRSAIGISEALIRLSAGIEDAGDLIADLDQALRKVS